MTDLIKRLEEAREPSRELDAEIAVTISRDADARVVWGKGRRFFLQPGPKRIPFAGCLGKGAKLGLVYQTVRYTSSVDAALSLVPEGWKCGFENNNLHDEQPDHSEAWLWPSESNFEPDWQLGYDCMRAASPDTHGHAATPALAICIAALKAKLADPPTPRPEAGEGVE